MSWATVPPIWFQDKLCLTSFEVCVFCGHLKTNPAGEPNQVRMMEKGTTLMGEASLVCGRPGLHIHTISHTHTHTTPYHTHKLHTPHTCTPHSHPPLKSHSQDTFSTHITLPTHIALPHPPLIQHMLKPPTHPMYTPHTLHTTHMHARTHARMHACTQARPGSPHLEH